MSDIKAIETQYNGYRFRSRLEARWAVFFDTLGVKYEYEPEGYQVEGTRYLPDFWIPEWDCFWEAKGVTPTEQEWRKCQSLWLSTCQTVLISVGQPWPNEHDVQVVSQEPYDPNTKESSFAYYDLDGLCIMTEAGISLDIIELSPPTRKLDQRLKWFIRATDPHAEPIRRAYLAARQARFEFGESGMLKRGR